MRRARLLAICAALAALPGRAPGQELDCLIEPRVTVKLATPVEGVIARVLVDRGDYVNEGDLLVEIESSVERATVEMARARAAQTAPLKSAQAALTYAEQTLERREELHRTFVSSEQELDEARSQHELAQERVHEAEEEQRLARLELERAREALGLRQIRSPISGVVIKREFDPGEYADTRPILELAEVDPLRVEVFAPVGLLGKIRAGSVAQVMPEDPVGGRYEATVVVVDSVIDAASGTFGVRLELPNPDHALPAGLNCRVSFGPGPLATAPSEAEPPPPVDAAPPAAEPIEPRQAEDAPEPEPDAEIAEPEVELAEAPEPERPRASVPVPAERDAPFDVCEEPGVCEVTTEKSLAAADMTPVPPGDLEPIAEAQSEEEPALDRVAEAGPGEVEPVAELEPAPVIQAVAAPEPVEAPEPVLQPEPVAAPEPDAEPETDAADAVAQVEPSNAAPAGTPAAASPGPVRRALFTSDIVDREPVDSIERLTTEQNALFFFSELRGLQGHTVTHRWEHAGVVRSEKSFEVGGPRWRVYSQIDLAPVWVGAWSVSVVDESGRVLDREEFEYVSAGPDVPDEPAPEPDERSAE